MSLLNLCAWLRGARRRPAQPADPCRVRPRVEALEQRDLPSTVLPNPQVVGTSGWHSYEGTVYDPTTSHTAGPGNGSWDLTAPGAYVASDPLAVTPGTVYTLSAFVRGTRAPLLGILYVSVYDASGNLLRNDMTNFAATSAAYTWQSTGTQYTAQAGDAYIKVVFSRPLDSQLAQTSTSVWVDDFSLSASALPSPQLGAPLSWHVYAGAAHDPTTSSSPGSGKGSWNLSPPGSYVASSLLPVTPGTEYTYSASLMGTSAAIMGSMYLGVYDASGKFLHNYAGSYQATTAAGVWQQASILYTAQPGEAYVELKFARLPAGRGPTDLGWLWVDNLQLTPGIAPGQAPPPKQSFDGARVRVDSLGNWYVNQGGTWQPYFVFGIYNGGTANTVQTYSNQGFNTLFNNTFSLAYLQQAKDAVSPYNPGGMMSMIDLSDYIDPRLPLYNNLGDLQQKLVALENSPLLSQVLGFYWDNEQYANYSVAQAVTNLVKQYDVNASGQRLHPIYMLNGQQGTDALYNGMVDVIGDYIRDPQTASYLPPQQDFSQRAAILATEAGQTGPLSIGTISEEAYATNLRRLVYESLLAGAHGVAYYRDGAFFHYNGDPNSPAATNIALRDSWSAFPVLRTEIEWLQPLLTTSTVTSWQLSSSVPTSQVEYGTRTYNGKGYVLLINPTTTSQTVTFTAGGLGYTPTALDDYFTGTAVAPVSANQFTVTLLPGQTAVYELA